MSAPVVPPPESAGDPPARRPRRWLRALFICVGAVVLLVAAAGAWFVIGRDSAEQVASGDALADFREQAGDLGTQVAAGLPAAGVYEAEASGTESIGLPGFDEELGPTAPVTVTHGDAGCFSYRVDFNSHHWRAWTYCPSPTATFALTGVQTWTARSAPGLNLDTTATYRCEEPLDVLWPDAVAGDRRQGSCTGTNDLDDGVTLDAAEVEVLDRTTVTVDGEEVAAVHVRTTETFSQAQSGSEVGEYWFDAATGLPLRISVDSRASGASGDYSERFELALTTLTPAT